MSKGRSGIVNVIVYLFVLLLLVGVVGAIVKLSGVEEEIEDVINPTFKILVNDESFTGNDNTLSLPESGQIRFEVKNGGKCTVKVVPNVTSNSDFTYKADGVECSFFETGELTSAFFSGSNIFGDYFVLNCGGDYSLKTVLTKVKNGAEIEVDGDFEYPYRLLITSENGDVIGIVLKITVQSDGITLNPDNIVF
jgi:hypothetical protein